MRKLGTFPAEVTTAPSTRPPKRLSSRSLTSGHGPLTTPLWTYGILWNTVVSEPSLKVYNGRPRRGQRSTSLIAGTQKASKFPPICEANHLRRRSPTYEPSNVKTQGRCVLGGVVCRRTWRVRRRNRLHSAPPCSQHRQGPLRLLTLKSTFHKVTAPGSDGSSLKLIIDSYHLQNRTSVVRYCLTYKDL